MSEPVGSAPRAAIPGNSHKDREAAQAQSAPRDKVEKIVEGKVTTRKAPLWKRVARSMIADDVQSMGDFIFIEVMVPAIQNLIRDIVVGGTDRALYGTSRARRGPGFGLGGGVGGIRTKYDQMSGEPRKILSRESRARHDFDEVVLDSHAEAVEVVEALIAMVTRYGQASVADLYDLVGVTGSHADYRWGWTDLRTADVRHSRGGFLLDLPQPEPLR